MTGVAALVALLAAAPAPHPSLPPYPKALRCAGLLESAVKGDSLVSPEARIRVDALIFWSFAAADGARAAKRSRAWFKQDQRDAAAVATPQLAAKEAAAFAELDACVKGVPPLKR